MGNEEIDKIVRDTIDFVQGRFLKTSLHERKALAEYLRIRLGVQRPSCPDCAGLGWKTNKSKKVRACRSCEVKRRKL